MKAKFILCTCLLLLLTISACKKNGECIDCIIIEGKVYTEARMEGAADVTVEIINYYQTANFPQIKFIDQTKTDKSGNFIFKLKLSDKELKRGRYEVAIPNLDLKTYFSAYPSGMELTDIINTKYYNFIIDIAKQAYLVINIPNQNEIDGEFHSWIEFEKGYTSYDTNFSLDYIPNSMRLEVPADYEFNLRTKKEKNGVITIKNDTISIKAGDTMYMDLIY